MAFLDEQSRAVLFEPPEAYEDAQARYALTSEDIVFVKEHRRSHNRLGFAIQLALVRDLGRLLRIGEVPPQAVSLLSPTSWASTLQCSSSTPSATKRAGNTRARSSLHWSFSLSGRVTIAS
nr:DUF4158 domain-containing protein [Rhizobium sp. ZX09]